MKIGSAVRPGRVPEKKRTGQDRTGQDSQTKKSQSGNISSIWGEAPTATIETKFCVVGHLDDVITYAKFQVEIFRGYDFTRGRISHFPIDFCMGRTTVQRDCAACDVAMVRLSDVSRKHFASVLFFLFYFTRHNIFQLAEQPPPYLYQRLDPLF